MERLATSKPHRVFLSCPAFGVPRAAESGDITFAISGDYFARKHAAHALVPAIGKKVMDLGSNVERAMAFKWVSSDLILRLRFLLPILSQTQLSLNHPVDIHLDWLGTRWS